jgi:hypothetical protein
MKIINVCAPNIRALKYIKQIQTDIKVEMESQTIIEGKFNASLSTMQWGGFPDRKLIRKH